MEPAASATASDQAEKAEDSPRGPLVVTGERCADPQTLGRVVEAEADDQDDRQTELIGSGGLADREPLGEIVQADAGGDEERQPAGRGHAGEVVVVLELRGRGGAGAEEGAP